MKENDGLSDFMKFAYSKGRVKKVEEALEEYPVEDEWHKGKNHLFVIVDQNNIAVPI